MPRIKYYDAESGDWKCADQESSSCSSQNADLSQNDPTQPDYVKNRTHWVEGEQTVIEWDGNTEGRESLDIEGIDAYVKVSNDIPEVSEFIGHELLVSDGETIPIMEDNVEVLFGTTSDGILSVSGLVWVINLSDATREGLVAEGASYPSNGICFYKSSEFYVTSLTYGSTTVHKLDEKFIPESIARVEDIPTGGVSSWNDLTDKPFYKENKQIVIEWNADSEYPIVNDYYKISDLIPTKSELIGAKAVMVNSAGESIEAELTEEYIRDVEPGLIAFGWLYVISESDGEVFTSTGVYLPTPMAEHISSVSITYGGIVYHPLDKNYLPSDLSVDFNNLTNKPFADKGYEEFIPESSVTISEGGNDSCLSYEYENCSFIEGDSYLVTVNGEQHECVAWWSDAIDSMCIGNGYICGGVGKGNNEPFVCYIIGNAGYINFIHLTAGTYAVKIDHHIIERLDPIYIPTSSTFSGVWKDLIDRPIYDDGDTVAFSTSVTISNAIYEPSPLAKVSETSLVDGMSYTVIVNGETYNCISWVYDGVVALGNGSLYGLSLGDDSPFLLVDTSYGLSMYCASGMYTITLTDSGGAVIVSETTVECYAWGTARINENCDIGVAEGEICRVTVNGTEYISTAKPRDGGGYDIVSDGCPFLFYYSNSSGAHFYLFDTLTGNGTYDITLVVTKFKQLDEKFIPDSIAKIGWIGKSPDDVEVLPELTRDCAGNGRQDLPSLGEHFIVGNTYTVTFDGTVYECVAREHEYGVIIGDGTVNHWDDISNGEPFACTSDSRGFAKLWIYDGNVHTIAIKLSAGQLVKHHTVDPRYIHDSIARTASTLPMPATASVGQFIMVSSIDENGKVTATEAVDAPTLPNAEEVAF